LVLGFLSVRGAFHTVGLIVGDDDGGLVQEPVDDAHCGGLLGPESASSWNGQCDPMARDRRS
jgi:hypothetical protein